MSACLNPNPSPLEQVAILSALRSLFEFNDETYGKWLYQTLFHLANNDNDELVVLTVDDLKFPLTEFGKQHSNNSVATLYTTLVVMTETIDRAFLMHHQYLTQPINSLLTVGQVLNDNGKLLRCLPNGNYVPLEAPLLSESEFLEMAELV
ncbi:hypothetical protein L1D14_04450 [Vibrio tubiashii]|uniref:hypothetical protein n=1 Tax=Vibrio tubiashii TaxID=29498 RepID=UPI001EFDF044|nr:hypothetical protein [Vibrio tubiashii]MCG9575483.1 hypothetical protein [Vibrio tubiashii]